MAVFLISYDLRKPGRDYAALYEALRVFGRRIDPLQSVRIVSTPWSAVQIRDYLLKFMDPNDRLVVTGLNGNAAWSGLAREDSETMLATLNAI